MSAFADTCIAFVGGGVMGEAVIRGLLAKQLAPACMIVVSDPVEDRRVHLCTELGVRATESNTQAASEAQIVVLAVKPQMLAQVLAELAGRVAAETLVLTLVAGARIEKLRQALGTPAIVRLMPNTPGQIGEGISVWTATPETSSEQRERAREIIAALGEEVYVEDEEHLDMATALSGSGPAYVFLFLEALIDVGVHMGFTRPVAQKLALQTVRGSAIYAQKMGLHPAILRNMVTSPGGTTAEGLCQLEEGNLRATIARAVWAAYRRAQSLGGLSNR